MDFNVGLEKDYEGDVTKEKGESCLIVWDVNK